MIEGLIRKGRQVASDPVLRRWVVGRVTGRHPPMPAFRRHHPPYLDGMLPLSPQPAEPAFQFDELSPDPPTSPLVLPLPGATLRLTSGDEKALFFKDFADTETLLALHRFAWLPLLGADADPAWVQALWTAWRRTHGEPKVGWPWHPYTAAERAINILDFARRRGLPGPAEDTLRLLAAHGPAIAGNLEYFGDHDTSNHLSNNGRGLYRLGLDLGLDACADLGGRILVEEAGRIFLPSGVLREGSSHYHLLAARNYADAWLAARAHERPEEEALRDIAARALAVVPHLTLPGGLPLIGDISPDCPPGFLAFPPAGLTGWAGGGWPDSKDALAELSDRVSPADAEALRGDGWLRRDMGPWSGLWYASPEGWSPMPGHGHQDMGGFEVHFEGEPVLVDPGRGAYGETGEAAFYRSGRAHNTLLVGGVDPYPPNKPYYDDGFRRRVAGPAPELRATDDGVSLRHHGFSRLEGVGRVSRRWRFSDTGMTVADDVDGTGARPVSRILITPLAAEMDGGAVVLKGKSGRFRIAAEDAAAELGPVTCWSAYGEGRPGTAIEFSTNPQLPWRSEIRLEVV